MDKNLYVPVKISKKYHGKLSQYKKKSNDYEYTLTFNEKNKSVSINISNHQTYYTKKRVIVNVKHNLFSLSNGSYYDCDRQLLKDYSDFCKVIDHINGFKSYNIGKRKQYKLDAFKRKAKAYTENIIIDMCKDLKNKKCNTYCYGESSKHVW